MMLCRSDATHAFFLLFCRKTMLVGWVQVNIESLKYYHRDKPKTGQRQAKDKPKTSLWLLHAAEGHFGMICMASCCHGLDDFTSVPSPLSRLLCLLYLYIFTTLGGLSGPWWFRCWQFWRTAGKCTKESNTWSKELENAKDQGPAACFHV